MWLLSPSGWPLSVDDGAIFLDGLLAAGYQPIDESQVQVAIDAYNNGQPPPAASGFVTVDLTGSTAGDLPALQADGTFAMQGLDELIDTTPITAADFGLAVPQGVRAYASATGQTITNGTYPVYLDLNTEEYNENAALFTIDFTGDKITVAEGGLFLVSWDADYSDTTGLREAYITKNGGNALAAAAAGSGGQTSRTFPLRLAANDYVQVICYVEGADVPLITNAPHRCGLALHRIGL